MGSIRHPTTVYATGVNAPNGAPTAVTDGIPYLGKAGNTEGMLMVTPNGTTAGDTITIRPWWWNPQAVNANKWTKGASTTITDSGVIEAYLIGTRIYWEVTAVTLAAGGSWDLGSQFFDKGN